MKKTGTAVRCVAMLLALTAVFSLTACKKKETPPEKVKLTNVYKSEAIALDESLQNIDRLTVVGDKVYFIGSGSHEDKTTGEYTYTSALYSMNMDGTGLETIMEMKNFDDPENQIYSSNYINNIAADGEGNLWVVEVEYYNDYSDPNLQINEQNTRLKKLDATGKVVAELDMKELAEGIEYFYVNSLVFDKTGNAYMGCEQTVFVLDAKTAELKLKLEDENYLNGLISTKSGDVYVLVWGGEGLVLKQVDIAKKGWGDPIKPDNSNMYNLIPGSGDFDFYYQDSVALMGYKIDTGESVEVVNWINSDIDNDRIRNVSALPDGRIIGIESSEDYSKHTLSLFTRKPDSEIQETIVLTYATMYINSDIRAAIIKFNRSQEEYRIQISDYSKYAGNDWQVGIDKLNMDIISGNIPDIINLSYLNVGSFISKGLIADVYPMIDNDPDISREDLLTNILEASSQNGKLYRIIPTFGINTIAGKASIVGDTPGWTMDDLNRLMNGMPEGTLAFSEMTKSDILSFSTYMAMGEFINNDTGECKFNGDAFIRLLEFANSFETEINWEALNEQEDYWMRRQESYKEDRTLLTQTYVYDVRSIRETKEQFGAPITYIGFPTENKNGSSISPQIELGISAKSKSKDAAWQFVRSFLLKDYFEDNRYSWGLPLNKHVLEDRIAAEKVPWNDRPENNGSEGVMISRAIAMPMPYPGGGEVDMDEYYRNYHLTDEEVNQLMSLITSVNQLTYNDAKVSEIITNEVEYYFNGNKDARAVAEIIQNKIQTYISESR